MGKLVIKFPTRNRPDKFKNVFTKYLTYLSGLHHVRFVVSMDADDQTMNNDQIKTWLNTRSKNADIKCCYGNSKSKIEACNADLEGEDGDVLLLASDDMMPIVMGYDKIIFAAFQQAFPDFDGAIKFWDGLRPKEDPLMTLAVMGFPLYRRFGYIYHPAYRSLFCDNEQTLVCQALGKLRRCDLCIIQHQWNGQPWDELHARNENPKMYDADFEVFKQRKSKKFDLG